MTNPIKWISRDGKLLGTVTTTLSNYEALSTSIKHRRLHEFAMMKPEPLSPYWYQDGNMPPLMMNYLRVGIERCYLPEFPDGFFIWGITPENLEQIPGWTFAPSVAYIQSLISSSLPAKQEAPAEPPSEEDVAERAWQATQDLSS